jgi:hypothetical protein
MGILHPEVWIGPVLPVLFVLVRCFIIRTVVAGTAVSGAAASGFGAPASET